MRILFIEDERALAATGVAQLEARGHEVVPVYELESARKFMETDGNSIHMIIADQRLPDGFGIEFLISIKHQYPRCLMAVVSGCLERDEMELLSSLDIPYFHKPLLYAKVLDHLRKEKQMTCPPVSSTEGETQAPDEAPEGSRARVRRHNLGELGSVEGRASIKPAPSSSETALKPRSSGLLWSRIMRSFQRR